MTPHHLLASQAPDLHAEPETKEDGHSVCKAFTHALVVYTVHDLYSCDECDIYLCSTVTFVSFHRNLS